MLPLLLIGLTRAAAPAADPSNGTCPKPATPPPPDNSACSLPRWNVSWAMRDSSYAYCFFHCPLDSLFKNNQSGLWGGVVGVDHYFTHQGMPCHGGLPDEFKAQDDYAIATKRRFPKARVLQYRITDAVPYAPIVHDKMVADPAAFIRWHGTGPGGLNNGSVCTVPPEARTGRPGDNCSWEIRAGACERSILSYTHALAAALSCLAPQQVFSLLLHLR